MLWPPCPFRIDVPKRQGNPYLLITKNDRKDHGDRARQLALDVCSQMIAWLKTLPQGSLIDQRHWEHKSYGVAQVAEEFSIFLDLDPPNVRADPSTHYLDRDLAYFAFQEYRHSIAVFGAMKGEFELHAHNFLRAKAAMHIFRWPRDLKSKKTTI